MKTMRNCGFAFGLTALFGAALLSPLPVQAQDAGAAPATPAHNITLSFQNAPIQAVLRTLFSSAGIKNFIIDADVQGYSNISVTDVPFGVALSALLRSVNPPLVYDVDNGLYHVKVQRADPTPVSVTPTVAPTAPPDNAGDATYRFYRIPIDKYDAAYIASLVGQTKGVFKVGANQVYGEAVVGGQSGGQSSFGSGSRSGGGGIAGVGGGSSSGFGLGGGFGGGSGGSGGGFGGGNRGY